MSNGDAGDWVDSNKRTVVFASVIVGTFHQHALHIHVAQLQIRADRRM